MKSEVKKAAELIETGMPTSEEMLKYTERKLYQAMKDTMEFAAALLMVTEYRPASNSRRVRVDGFKSKMQNAI